MIDDRPVTIRVTPEQAESMLEQFYQAKHEGKKETTFTLTFDVGKGIKQLEKKFPELAKGFKNDR